jgi:plasmid stability protein
VFCESKFFLYLQIGNRMPQLKMTTFWLDEETKRILRIEAARRGVTMSDLIRDAVTTMIQQPSFFAESAKVNSRFANNVVQNGAE